MKSTKTLVLAASILVLTLSALPHVAAASTGSAPQADPDMTRKSGGSALKYVEAILAGGTLILALLS
jgi:hypothetical protein